MGRRLSDDEARAIMFAIGVEPLEKYPGVEKPWLCRCLACGREISPRFRAIKSGQGACGYCAGNRIDPTDAVQRMVAANLTPIDPYSGSTMRPWRCRCNRCGKEVSPTLSNITNGQGGCGYCAGRRLDESDAVAVLESVGLRPLEPFPGSGERWNAQCVRCGREVVARYSTAVRGNGCAWCAGNRIESSVAVQAMLDQGLQPDEKYPGADTPWKCICQRCGLVVMPTYSSVKAGRGCNHCGNRRSAEKRTLSETDAVAMMLSAGLEPLEPYPRSALKPWRCRCGKCQREVTPTYATIQQGKGGCRYCADYGFDWTAPGVVYLLWHDGFFATKVGVTTAAAKNDRVKQHAKFDWQTHRLWNVPTGDAAFRVERQTLDWWRNVLSAPEALTEADMPQGGWTETVSLLWASLEATTAFIDQLVSSFEHEAGQ